MDIELDCSPFDVRGDERPYLVAAFPDALHRRAGACQRLSGNIFLEMLQDLCHWFDSLLPLWDPEESARLLSFLRLRHHGHEERAEAVFNELQLLNYGVDITFLPVTRLVSLAVKDEPVIIGGWTFGDPFIIAPQCRDVQLVFGVCGDDLHFGIRATSATEPHTTTTKCIKRALEIAFVHCTGGGVPRELYIPNPAQVAFQSFEK